MKKIDSEKVAMMVLSAIENLEMVSEDVDADLSEIAAASVEIGIRMITALVPDPGKARELHTFISTDLLNQYERMVERRAADAH